MNTNQKLDSLKLAYPGATKLNDCLWLFPGIGAHTIESGYGAMVAHRKFNRKEAKDVPRAFFDSYSSIEDRFIDENGFGLSSN